MLLSLLALICVLPGFAAESDDRWWPVQAFPKAVIRTANQQEFPEPRAALQMMVQSVAGLAAKAVNEGRGDELVWVYNGDGDLEKWYARLLAAHPGLARPGAFEPWQLVDHYVKQRIIKGYILYRPGPNCSVNVATSLAGLLDGIIVDEELEPAAKGHGLKPLLDIREKTQQWCFQTYQNLFNRRMICVQDPRKPHVRDLAIAQKAPTLFGQEEPTPAAMAWLEPLSPVLGANEGDEFVRTDLSTRYGDIQTSTDWCLNLPVLMAGTEKLDLPKMKHLNPGKIDWKDSRSAISFVLSDGDNVQWVQGNFFGGGDSYWGNAERGKIPFGWSCCFTQLAQLCPQAINYALETQSSNDCLIEWGGGYYYPDLFGRSRTNRWELLARQARRTWELMKKTDTRIIGFNCAKVDSEEARRAYEAFASQTGGLLAILVFQYSPYEGGAGKTFWVKDRNGLEVPVISARYTIWNHSNDRERAGTPAKVAREIRDTVKTTPRCDWVIVHAWSYFQRRPGSDEDAENMPQENASAAGGVRGYSPVVWCAERLPASIRTVSPEELIWRIRMQHDPAQTKKLISQFQ